MRLARQAAPLLVALVSGACGGAQSPRASIDEAPTTSPPRANGTCQDFDPPPMPPPASAAADRSAAPPPTVASAAAGPTVPGADAVVSSNSWRFRGCLGKAIAEDQHARGWVTVAVTVDANGKVTHAEPDAGGHCPSSLGRCVAGTFYSMQFPAPEGGTATFKVTANFGTR